MSTYEDLKNKGNNGISFDHRLMIEKRLIEPLGKDIYGRDIFSSIRGDVFSFDGASLRKIRQTSDEEHYVDLGGERVKLVFVGTA